MSPLSRFRHVRNPLTLFGIWLTTVSAILFLVVFFADLFGLVHNPYLGILFFLVLPAFFVVGLLLVPARDLLARGGASSAGRAASTSGRSGTSTSPATGARRRSSSARRS